MKYLNAKDILPKELLKLVQQHTDGVILYIPSKTEARSKWGNKNGARRQYEERNKRIRELYEMDFSFEEIAGRFYLSVDSIRKIIKSQP